MRIMVVLVVAALILSFFAGWRVVDHLADRDEIKRLLTSQSHSPQNFDHEMVADLPKPAQRFFRFAIAEGTPLWSVAEIRMTGQFSIGSKQAPNYMKMQARQVLASPQGFVWKVRLRSGHLGMSGSDSGLWTRFWMGGLIPIARQGGSLDHARSAFGRYVAESIFWTPAAVLAGPGITWSEIDHETARLRVEHDGMLQEVDVTVAQDGKPLQVIFQRWSAANPDQVHRLQPFGGKLSEFRDFQGYMLPTHVEAGNFFGTDDYFPFYIADITEVSFPRRSD